MEGDWGVKRRWRVEVVCGFGQSGEGWAGGGQGGVGVAKVVGAEHCGAEG